MKHGIRHSGELISAIEAVARGELVVDPGIVSALVRTTGRYPRSSLEELTVRERELLALVAEGKSNAAIAKSLFITQRAVEKHLTSIFPKLGLEASRSAHTDENVKGWVQESPLARVTPNQKSRHPGTVEPAAHRLPL